MDTNKEKKKIEKRNIIIIILVILTFITAIIGATFAYYAANVIGNDTASSVLIHSSSLTVSYKTTNEINEQNIGPGFSKNLYFTISNTSAGTAGYKIKWLVGTNTFTGTDLVYSLSGTTNKNDDILVNKTKVTMPTVSSEIGDGAISSGSTQSYTLKVEFPNKNADQTANENKTFTGKIEVVGA